MTPPALFDSFEQYVFESNREGKLEGFSGDQSSRFATPMTTLSCHRCF